LRQKRPGAALVLKDQSNLYGVTAAGLVTDLARQLPHLLTPEALASIHMVDSNLTLGGLRRLYGSADAYVSPYRAEGFNLPPLEAAACGLPVIVTRGGPSDDYADPAFAVQVESRRMRSDELGVYLEPDLDHLIACMDALMERPLDGGKGRAYVTERFSWKNATRRLVDVLGGAR
jgi:glycosyltransferase involved in cell wall biosynthesis